MQPDLLLIVGPGAERDRPSVADRRPPRQDHLELAARGLDAEGLAQRLVGEDDRRLLLDDVEGRGLRNGGICGGGPGRRRRARRGGRPAQRPRPLSPDLGRVGRPERALREYDGSHRGDRHDQDERARRPGRVPPHLSLLMMCQPYGLRVASSSHMPIPPGASENDRSPKQGTIPCLGYSSRPCGRISRLYVA